MWILRIWHEFYVNFRQNLRFPNISDISYQNPNYCVDPKKISLRGALDNQILGHLTVKIKYMIISIKLWKVRQDIASLTSELDNLRATEVVAKIDADYQDDSNNDDDVDDNHNKICGNDNSSYENHNGTNNEDDNNYNGLGDNDNNDKDDNNSRWPWPGWDAEEGDEEDCGAEGQLPGLQAEGG